jgi:hypothetical protein
MIAAVICANQYAAAIRMSIRRAPTKPSVTAGLKCLTGDVTDGRRHHADRQAVREGDRREVLAAGGDDRPGADEDQSERPDELGKGALQNSFCTPQH